MVVLLNATQLYGVTPIIQITERNNAWPAIHLKLKNLILSRH